MPLRSCVRLVPLAMSLLAGTACTALAGGDVTVTEVDPPPEVTR